jgi:dUTP pyrophosphatase
MSQDLQQKLLQTYGQFMRLKIMVASQDEALHNKYAVAINTHHAKMWNDVLHIDAGFDLYAPQDVRCVVGSPNKIDYQVVCSAQIVKPNNVAYNTGFYMYPRSSISKTHLRLANNVGIIDAGYRGHLIGMFDYLQNDNIGVRQFDRHVQVCGPGLVPIIVELVSGLNEENTIRGAGGFGSTGLQ